MKVTIDTDESVLLVESEQGLRRLDLYSRESFELISRFWVKVGWNEKYPYTFTWLGRPIIQLPEDLLRVQEVIYRVKPDIIVETGVAHGGSLVFYASLCRALGKGRVIGVDIEIRPSNRAAIESHVLAPLITLLEGSSTDAAVVSEIREQIGAGDAVLVILDSNHSKNHVLAELEAYHGFVSPGSYIVATDSVMQDVHDAPRGNPKWRLDNPSTAVREFLARHSEFRLEEPAWAFNESNLRSSVTHWPDAWLRRIAR